MQRSLCLVLALGLCACAGSKTPSSTVHPSASEIGSQSVISQGDASKVAKDALPEPRFSLLEVGQDPKTLLALAPKVGARVEMRTSSDSVSSVFVAGQLVSKTPSPTAVTTVQAKVLSVSPKEIKVDLTSRHSVEPVQGGDPAEFERLKSKRETQGSAHGVLTFNTRGQRTASEFDRGDKELISWDANIALAWPEVPVGPGARWQTVLENSIDGIDCVVTTTVTLLNIEEGKALLEVNSVTVGTPGRIEVPGIPQSIEVELVSMELKLKGQYVRSIEGVYQEQGEMQGTREVVMKLKAQGQEREMRSQADISFKTSFGLPSSDQA